MRFRKIFEAVEYQNTLTQDVDKVLHTPELPVLDKQRARQKFIDMRNTLKEYGYTIKKNSRTELDSRRKTLSVSKLSPDLQNRAKQYWHLYICVQHEWGHIKTMLPRIESAQVQTPQTKQLYGHMEQFIHPYTQKYNEVEKQRYEDLHKNIIQKWDEQEKSGQKPFRYSFYEFVPSNHFKHYAMGVVEHHCLIASETEAWIAGLEKIDDNLLDKYRERQILSLQTYIYPYYDNEKMYEKNDGKDVKEFMSIEEIKTELDKNLSLDDLFEKLGITRQQIQEHFMTQRDEIKRFSI